MRLSSRTARKLALLASPACSATARLCSANGRRRGSTTRRLSRYATRCACGRRRRSAPGMAELLLEGNEDEEAEGQRHLDFAISELREMKMQPWLERALKHKGLLKA